MNRKQCAIVGGAIIASAAAPVGADIVREWNDTFLSIVRLQGGSPGSISRASAMINVAIFDAVNAIDRTDHFPQSFKPYLRTLAPAPSGASREAAAVAAAYTIFSNIYPMQSDDNPSIGPMIQLRHDTQMALIPDGPAKANGIAVGEAVGGQMLLLRFLDGSEGNPTYIPGGQPGDWCVTPDGPFVPALAPHWGNVRTWALDSADQFRPTRLAALGSMNDLVRSAAYAEQINGSASVPSVKTLGARASAVRTADQTEAAWFWANDRQGTSKPPGHLIQITQRVAEDQGLSLSQSARLFALVSMGMADAGIAAWDIKYNTPIDLWRPIDAIRETMDDSNPLTTPDPAWLPLNDFTPPFPAYVSGHATFGAVHAAVLRRFFGTDFITFTIGSDEFSVHPSLGYPAGLTRTFTSFSQAAWENAMSRIWLGVHFEWDAVDGNVLGTQIGEFISDRQLRPVRSGPCPADLNADQVVDNVDFVTFSDQYALFDCTIGAMPADCVADINSDGVVDAGDFVLFSMAYFDFACPE